MRPALKALTLLVASAAIIAWLSRTPSLGEDDLPVHRPDPGNGEIIFHVGGCASCHGSPDPSRKSGRPDALRMGGGLALQSPVGRFFAPNISPHPEDGIGGWTELQFINAMQRGLAPDGSHYYPAFPYTSYARADRGDLLDLKAYLDGLPPVAGRAPSHELDWPYRWRWTLGLWKRLYLDDRPVIERRSGSAEWSRGRYLVEGPGHCGECHTPRNALMAVDRDAWLAGAALPDGEGKAPRLRPGEDGLGGWSLADISYYLETGVDPDFDVVGGPMVAVQENLARLSDTDRAAIANYLKSLPE